MADICTGLTQLYYDVNWLNVLYFYVQRVSHQFNYCNAIRNINNYYIMFSVIIRFSPII